MTSPELLTASQAAEAIASGALGAEELAQAVLKRVEDGAALNAFNSIVPEKVLAAARAADTNRARGEALGPLHGVPVSFKDNINVVGHPNTGGTPVLRNFYPQSDARVVEKMYLAGAISLGKVGLHELAYGSTSINPAFGSPRNPHAPDRVAGGSSGGCGTAVGAFMGPLSIGTDTGGSVRIPASFCGTWGYRPTVGRWPTAGIIPISTSRDTPGPLARSARDLALADFCVTGQRSEMRPLQGLRIGISEKYFWEHACPQVAELCRRALEVAVAEGAVLVPVDASDMVAPNQASAMTVPFYEGRVGLIAFLAEHGVGLSYAEVADAIGSPDVRAVFDEQRDPARQITHEAYILAATVDRPALIAAGASLFARHRLDLLASPTILIPPPLVDGPAEITLGGQSLPVFQAIIHNVDMLSNAAFCGVSIPAGLTAEGLPVGLALDAPPAADARVLAAALAFEQAFDSSSLAASQATSTVLGIDAAGAGRNVKA
jgi:Asp-tRNA(Asn)/Glu-tRNA(Gln) amidotransferase A subunit family amidase